MAAARGLDVKIVKQRPRRDLLDISAQEGSNMANACVLNLSSHWGARSFARMGLSLPWAMGVLACSSLGPLHI